MKPGYIKKRKYGDLTFPQECYDTEEKKLTITCKHIDFRKKLYMHVADPQVKIWEENPDDTMYRFALGAVDFEVAFCPFCGFSYQPERLSPETPEGEAIV